MIKQYLKKSKINIFFTGLEIILILASFLLNYLSFKKMGLMRHLMFKNYMYDKSNIYFTLTCILIVLICIYLFLSIRYKFVIKNLIFVIFIVISFLSFNKFIPKFKFDFYFQSFIFLTISFIEILKICVNVIKKEAI